MNKLMIKALNNRLKNIKFVSLVCVLFIFSAPLSAQENSRDNKLELSRNFTLKNQYNKNIKLTELRGQVVVLSFWANWCGSCMPSLRNLERLQRKYKDRAFVVLAINIEQGVKKNTGWSQKLQLPVLFDDYGMVSRLYDVESIPMIILIDRDGYSRHVIDADQLNNFDDIESMIKALLDE